MRKIILICLCMMFFSCQSQKRFVERPFLAVYKRDRAGLVDPAYIIFRTQPKVFETYAPGVSHSIFGEWNMKNDTLFLFPKWGCYSRDYKINFVEVTGETMASIPQQFIMKGNSLFDITDYSVVIPEYLYNNDKNPEEFRRIK